MSMPRCLVVDDDPSSRNALSELVQMQGFTTVDADSVDTARRSLRGASPDVAIIDVCLPDGSGLDLMRELGDRSDRTHVVMVTGFASLDSAVGALRTGARDYLTKPIDIGRLKTILGDVARSKGYTEGIDAAPEPARRVESGDGLGRLVGASEPMRELYHLVKKVAPTNATILLSGESGTGKELVAETVHQLSRRAKGPFIAVNCAAISPTLIETELFGHERGSFTGAVKRHSGFFERANGGTLFLDEITEMPVALQPKLLRALETGKVMPVGGDRPVDVDVRVIAATNREPGIAAAGGELREDLLYRLSVFPINMPPLRKRPGDVELLASNFLQQLNDDHDTWKILTPAAVEKLRSHAWPGNVRELKNLLHRAFILSGKQIDAADLPFEPGRAVREQAHQYDLQMNVGMTISEAEKRLLLATLSELKGDKPRTARTLGISLRTLYNRLNQYNATDLLRRRSNA